jgi:hypothetical protein
VKEYKVEETSPEIASVWLRQGLEIFMFSGRNSVKCTAGSSYQGKQDILLALVESARKG